MRRLLAYAIAARLLAAPGLLQSAQQPPKESGSVPAAPAPRQSQQPSRRGATIHKTVNLVLIDVQVTDRAGKPIKGLKPEQFTLLEDDRQQKISSFNYYDIEAMETAEAAPAQPIVVPLGTLAPSERAREAVRGGGDARAGAGAATAWDVRPETAEHGWPEGAPHVPAGTRRGAGRRRGARDHEVSRA